VTALKIVKIVSDGKRYWRLWHWYDVRLKPQDFQPVGAPPDHLAGAFFYVSGPFADLSKAREAIPNEWKLEDFNE